jgi:hypothetical protein
MKKQILLMIGTVLISSISLNAHAGWWSDTWETTKEKSISVWDSITDQANETKEDLREVKDDVRESSSESLEDIKKLGDKKTYTEAWKDIKESAKNPSKPDVDENGIPKE